MKLPAPSNATRIVLKTGTFSGVDVLEIGKIEPGAAVQLKDGTTAMVTDVEGKRLSWLGVTRGSVQVQRADGTSSRVDPAEIAGVLHPAAH